MKINLQKIITPSIFTTAFTFLTAVGLWVFFYFVRPVTVSSVTNTLVFVERFIPLNSLWAYVVSLIVMLLTAILITQFNNKYAYINTRTFIHTFLFLMLSTVFLLVHGNYPAYIAALLVLFALYLFLGNYGNRNGTEVAFLGFIFLGTSFYFVPQYILLIPFVWIGFYQLKALSGRVFFASILGAVVPTLAAFGIHYMKTGTFNYMPDFLIFINHFSFIYVQNIPALIFGILFLIVFFILLVGMAASTHRETIKTRKILFFFQTIAFGWALLPVLFSVDLLSYLPLGIVFYAIFASYTFTNKRTFFYSVLFIILCIISAAFAVYQLLLY